MTTTFYIVPIARQSNRLLPVTELFNWMNFIVFFNNVFGPKLETKNLNQVKIWKAHCV